MFTFNRRLTVFFHVCIWTVLILCVLLWRPRNQGMSDHPMTNVQIILAGLPFIAIFYVHAYWLIPGYLFRKRLAVYFISVLVASLVVVYLSEWLFYLGSYPPDGVHHYPLPPKRVFPVVFMLIASASLGAFRESFRLEKNRKEKETEHLRTELSFLRSQVNPHFMLNVLNSMALLARRKSDLLEPVLMELASLMSYMLYDANNEKIPLWDEVKYLGAYIDLQMLRFGNDVVVRFDTPEQPADRYIEPMLLIPLVENAFKHGIGLVTDPEIFIDIRIEQENRLIMTVKNKYSQAIRRQENKPAGIGLKNLKKRLELIHPDQFELNTSDNYHVEAAVMESWFVTTLNIPLQ